MAEAKKSAEAVEKVTIRLPRARDGEEKEQFVGVNGEFFRIKKGVDVEVPVYVAEVLRNMEEAEQSADDYEASLNG